MDKNISNIVGKNINDANKLISNTKYILRIAQNDGINLVNINSNNFKNININEFYYNKNRINVVVFNKLIIKIIGYY